MDIKKFIESLSKEEFSKLESYFFKDFKNQITLEKFLSESNCSTMLRNCLKTSGIEFINGIEYDDVIKVRGVGKQSAEEFISLKNKLIGINVF
jgi:DNA-directed RNA polymerase alpha subunit